MKRTLIAIAPPAALVAGLFLAHCSSSSPVVVSGDSGADSTSPGSGTGTGKGTGTGTGSSGTGSAPGSGTGSAPGSGTGTGMGGGGLIDGATGDNDAACAPPTGGDFCTPGHVTCTGVDGGCAVPSTVCCETPDAAPACKAPADCSPTTNIAIGCNERADCHSTQICCLSATGTTTASTSCVDPVAADGGFGCPSPSGSLGTAQICRSSAECPAGVTCSFWSCVGVTIESCGVPSGLLAINNGCTPVMMGSGSGSGTGSGTGSGSGSGTGTGSGT